MTKLNIFIAGHRGMVGSELMRQLQQNPKVNLITASREELDLTSQADVQAFFQQPNPDWTSNLVIVATYPLIEFESQTQNSA